MSDKEERKVSWTIFAWAMGINLLLAGWFFTMVSAQNMKIEAASAQSNEVKIQLSQIQTDLQWIKSRLADGEKIK